jgi:hypothetical protein
VNPNWYEILCDEILNENPTAVIINVAASPFMLYVPYIWHSNNMWLSDSVVSTLASYLSHHIFNLLHRGSLSSLKFSYFPSDPGKILGWYISVRHDHFHIYYLSSVPHLTLHNLCSKTGDLSHLPMERVQDRFFRIQYWAWGFHKGQKFLSAQHCFFQGILLCRLTQWNVT